MSGPVVTQADRDAAARLAHEIGETWMRSERIRRGECEGFSEDFAHHRQQSTAPLIAAMEAAAEALEALSKAAELADGAAANAGVYWQADEVARCRAEARAAHRHLRTHIENVKGGEEE